MKRQFNRFIKFIVDYAYVRLCDAHKTFANMYLTNGKYDDGCDVLPYAILYLMIFNIFAGGWCLLLFHSKLVINIQPMFK